MLQQKMRPLRGKSKDANVLRLLYDSSLRSFYLAILSVFVIQSVLLNHHIDAAGIGFFNSVTGSLGAIGAVLYLLIAGAVKNQKRMWLWMEVIRLSLPILMIVGIVFFSDNPIALLILATGAMTFFSIAGQLEDAIAFVVRSRVFSAHNISQVMGLQGSIAGVAGVLGSGFILLVNGRFPYPTSIYCLMAVAFVILSVNICNIRGLSLERFDAPRADARTPVFQMIVRLFKLSAFNKMIIPTVLRGITVVSFQFILSISELKCGPSNMMSSFLVTATTISTISGNFFFFILSKKLKTYQTLLMGGLLHAVSWVALILCHNAFPFMIVCFCMFFVRMLVDIGVPVSIMETVPADMVGVYNAARTLIMLGTVGIFSYPFGLLLKEANVDFILIATAVISALMATLMASELRKMNRVNEA